MSTRDRSVASAIREVRFDSRRPRSSVMQEWLAGRYGRPVRGIWLVVTLLIAGACTTVQEESPGPASAESTALSLPTRPRDLPLDGVEPCSLLTEQQRLELGLDGRPASSTKPSALFRGDETICLYSGSFPRAVFVGVGMVTTMGIESIVDHDLDAALTGLDIHGFPAARAVPKRFTKFCSVFIGVAPGQLVDVQFSDGGREPPIPQGSLCSDAEQVAKASMLTLLAS